MKKRVKKNKDQSPPICSKCGNEGRQFLNGAGVVGNDGKTLWFCISCNKMLN
jgi:hypothetical protein